MLPVESLTDAVSFLPLYDLDSVLLANRQLSNIATKCVNEIPVWGFGYVSMSFGEDLMALFSEGDVDHVIDGKRDVADVLEIALHNSRFQGLSVVLYPFDVDSPGVTKSPADIIPLPNKSSLEIKELVLYAHGVQSAHFFVDILARFRKVRVSSCRLLCLFNYKYTGLS